MESALMMSPLLQLPECTLIPQSEPHSNFKVLATNKLWAR